MNQLRKPCLVCGRLTAPGKSRCDVHLRMYEAQRTAIRRVTRTGASTKARAALNSAGYGRCAVCGNLFRAVDIEVDHIRPLSKGGQDESYNLQYLCLEHHREKSAEERRWNSP